MDNIKPSAKADTKPWYSPRDPRDITAYPWLHPHAVEFFEALLQPGWRVLEHGAGGSTLWLASRVSCVVSLEHDHAWRKKVRELAPDNVKVLSLRLNPEDKFLGKNYDLFFIDGERMERRLCLEAAPKLVRPGGWVVLDNANRPEYKDERWAMAKRFTLKARFNNNIPGSLYFVTEFWQCPALA